MKTYYIQIGNINGVKNYKVKASNYKSAVKLAEADYVSKYDTTDKGVWCGVHKCDMKLVKWF